MQELDAPAAKNENFKAKSTRKVTDIATAVQSTKSKEFTHECSVSMAISAKVIEMKSIFCILLGLLVLERYCKKHKQKVNKPNGKNDKLTCTMREKKLWHNEQHMTA